MAAKIKAFEKSQVGNSIILTDSQGVPTYTLPKNIIDSIIESSGSIIKTSNGLIDIDPNILNRLTALEYKAITINSFTNNVNIVELGNVINSITFNYAFNKVPTTLSINNGIGSLVNTSNTSTKSVSLSSNTTFVLTAFDGQTTVTASSSVLFQNMIYYGTNASNTLTNSQILALQNKVLSGTKNRTITLNGGGQYIYYIYPASMGDAIFTINGLVSNALTKTVINVTNQYNNITSYNVYVTNTVQNGTNIGITIS